MIKNIIKKTYLGIILLFIYLPIFVMMVLSFNSSKSRVHFQNFTFDWYLKIFDDRYIVAALQNTLLIAFISSIVAVLIGTMAAIAITKLRSRLKNAYLMVTNIPMLNADIATGISLMLCFITFGITLSFKTILLSHITFNIPYVILSVLPKLNKETDSLYDAALDLGASGSQAFFKVVLPEIMPGIFSGFLLSLTMSLDDFIITHFTRGAGVNTLSTLIYSQVKRGLNPSMYALSTIIFIAVLVALIIINIVSNHEDNKK